MRKKKKSSVLLSKKTSVPLFQILGLKKKVDKNFVFSMENVAKKLINSLINR